VSDKKSNTRTVNRKL